MPSDSLSAFISPARYIQGRGALSKAGHYLADLGQRVLVIWDRHVAGLAGHTVAESLRNSGLEMTAVTFHGEVTADEIERLQGEANQHRAEVIAGVGGGKTLDMAKAVGLPLGLAVATLPTLASTDAPTSALAVVYKENGEFAEYRFFRRCPNLVLVDTDVIVQAPTRYLVSGMGDALATWFEARTAAHAFKANMAGGLATSTALRLAHLCYQTLLEHGQAARLATQHKAITPAFERIVEANTLLSGLGFESGGLGAAHAIHNGLTALSQLHDAYHGEKVAVGALAQLVLEGRPEEEIHEALDFCLDVGLPAGYNDAARSHVSRDDLRRVAELAVAPGESMHNEPMPVTAVMVEDALLAADAIAQARRHALGFPEHLRRAA
jgi:glycerol dehydrogenase